MSTVIQCRDVIKTYDDKKALNGLTLDIPEQSIVGVLGPNGCGKSTFFRSLVGLVQPDSGVLEILNQKPNWRNNADIAYLPDRARWYPNHTVRRAFDWAESFLPHFIREQAEKLADFMELDLDLKARGMSKGQEARLMLILCMARDVPVVILDEPFSGIDVLSREQIIEGIIDYLHEREQTILISTHEIHEIEGLFDFTVLMDKGKAIWTGRTEALRAEYGSMHQVFRSLYKRGLEL
ncbi:ABC transporter ATP-binding protein [Pullulanibacillus camelliae]|uniref:ABC transporter ATP-binding protein n=1 Tax=Pullulanibacillus camelliae TaxID=1707096 RepID=A0A8J2YNY3_9BACL|nr:ABC transporter ATP-binding protein [Pullulanibacillus camelliae]GGE56887.1 ABC transporter ATP-binding protein [Pullulanibacillus camelliae]